MVAKIEVNICFCCFALSLPQWKIFRKLQNGWTNFKNVVVFQMIDKKLLEIVNGAKTITFGDICFKSKRKKTLSLLEKIWGYILSVDF